MLGYGQCHAIHKFRFVILREIRYSNGKMLSQASRLEGQRTVTEKERRRNYHQRIDQDADVQACGDTDRRRMAKEFDSLFPLYLIQPEEDIYRKMKLRNRSESLLFTKWASHLKPHIEPKGQASHRPQTHRHNDINNPYRSQHIGRENLPTRQRTSSQDVFRQTAMSHPSGVGTFIPVHCPQRRDVRMGSFASSSPVGFLVSLGGGISQSNRQRKTIKKRDKT